MQSKLKILVADDLEIIRQTIADIVEKNENVAIARMAKDGKEELELILSYNPDIVFTDMRMPEMTGMEVIEKINQIELKRKPQFILVTADADLRLSSKARELNFSIENKPINADRINEYINNFHIEIERE